MSTSTRSAMPKPAPRSSTGKIGTQDVRSAASERASDGTPKAEKVTVRQKLDEVTKPLRVKLFGRTSTSSGTTKTTTTPTRTPTTPTTPTKTLTPTKTTTSVRTITTPTGSTTTKTTRTTVFSSKEGPKTKENPTKITSSFYPSKESSVRYVTKTTSVTRTVTKGDEVLKTVKTTFSETPEKRILSKTPLSEKSDKNVMPRTPSEEVLQDSCYHTNISLSKSSSAASMTLDSDEYLLRRTPSRDRMDLDSLSVGSGTSSSKGSEWYQEYKSQSFQNFNSKLERVLTRQEYDSHIAEIKGESFFFFKNNFKL